MKIRRFELVPTFTLLKNDYSAQWMQRQLNLCWTVIFESASDEFDVVRIADEYGFDVLWYGFVREQVKSMKCRFFQLKPKEHLRDGDWSYEYIGCIERIFELASMGSISTEDDVEDVAEEYGFDLIWLDEE